MAMFERFGKKKEKANATKNEKEAEVVGAVPAQKVMSKEEEARAESSRARETEELPPPQYTGAANASTSAEEAPPYISLAEDVNADIRSLAIGDPAESISVPMIHSTEDRTLKDMLASRPGKITRTVIVRKMPRSHYLKYYAKDADGNYVGTEKAAVDAGLVFVPSKSTPEDILQQVRKVAFGKEHYVDKYAAMGYGLSLGAGGGGAM